MTGEVFKTVDFKWGWLLLVFLFACGQKSETEKVVDNAIAQEHKADSHKSETAQEADVPKEVETTETSDNNEEADASFSEITVNDGITIDIKYATKNNFTKKIIYPCGRCYLRPEVAEKIVKAHEWLQKEHGLGLKMFDCYRPRPAQQRLWDVVPDPDYVTPPAKGSMHNRGLAVDLTLVDAKGKELNMGTPYDFFGKEAHTDNISLPAEVLKNRNLLKQALTAQGFSGIRTEWWHFSLNISAPLSDWEWPCNQ